VYDLVVDPVAVLRRLPLPEREVYVNAPLRLVTAEYRFPLSAALSGGDLLPLLARELGSTLPIIEPAPALQLTLGPDLAPPALTNGYRLLTRDRMTAVTVSPSRLAVETTAYGHWVDFRDEYVRVALVALGDELDALAGLDRVGLRYINEIRVPLTSGTTHHWHTYVNRDLLAPAAITSRGALKTVQVALHLQVEDQSELLLRSGILEGHVVDNSGPLQLPSPPKDGPFFLIDIDSFWTRSGALDEWNTAGALAISNRLHDPIDELFETCITEALRDDVLRRKP
jgi:uncharacterized protein (TIGR04255 family)